MPTSSNGHDSAVSNETETHAGDSTGSWTRRKYLATAGSAGVLSLAGCIGGSSGGSDDTITVGYALPESGSYAQLSQYMRNGFELAVDHERDGQLGDYDVEYVERDTDTDPSTGVSATRELITEENVDILAGPISSAVMNAMIEEVRDEDVVWFNLHSGDPTIVKDGCLQNQFNPSFNLWQTSYPMGEWVYENIAETAHIMHADYAGGRGASQYFPEAFEEAGGTITGYTGVDLGTSDFAPALQEVQSSDADIVYSFFAGGDAINFVTSYRDFGIEKSLLGEGWLTAPNLLGPIGDAAVGMRTSLHYSPALENEANQQFTSNYTEQYDTGPNVMSVAAYDGGQILARVVEDAGGFGVEEFNEVVPEVEIDSPRGPLSFQPETHEPVQNMYVREVAEQDGQLVANPIHTFEAVESPEWGCDLS